MTNKDITRDSINGSKGTVVMCECEKEKGERLARGVWYYDQPLPEGRKNDTAPIQFILVARMNGSLIVAANPWFEGD